MKLFKLTAVATAVLGSSVAAMAANQAVVYETQPAVVVTDVQPANQVVVVDAQPVAYQYDQNAGVIANTTGAVVGTTRTIFDTVVHPAAVSAEIGTLGYGANIAWGLNDTTELTAGWNGFSDDGTKDLDASDSWINWGKALGDGYGNFQGDMKYDADFSNPYLGVNLRPWATNFTVGTGIIVPDNELKARLTTDNANGADIKINGTKYTVANAQAGGYVDAKVENRNTLAPYLTIGYHPNIDQKWGLFGEIGAAYMGKMDANIDAKNVTVNGVDATEKFKEEARKDIEDNDVWYPIVKAGLTYRF
ncbi:hypothetical protein [Psychrobacter sanguinis]|uniref:hypothetical protein n=1 Tax=Psychrobacter sanguinis TaxID=861445 RepID=UPI00191A2A6D|nr:hypothetical protein [Psychrobacter sanguinis]MCC3308064.1 hypothetical protein [Psychrobacter sanguinis]MCC3344178.1 hypothetical protein [Psychrobacter sanguinis]MDY3306114.1 hypothetical protein [Psychrobacter sanguinis]UEC25348.1 hypothetical protein LK453_12650 [Psychrobacter sanguinis]